MAKPKLADRLEIAKAKESYEKSKKDLSKKSKAKKDNEKTEEIITVTNDDLKNKEEQDKKEAEFKENGSEQQTNTLEEPKELTKLEKKKAREAKREAKRAKKEALREIKLKESKEEERNDDDDGEPIIEVESLDKELQKDFANVVAVDHQDDEEEEEEDESDKRLELEKLAKSDNEEDDDEAEEEENEQEEENEEEEEDVAYSDVEFDSDADIVPHTKVIINKTAALEDSYNRIRLPWEDYPFTEHQSITSNEAAVDSIKDIYDDTERELSFYKQGLNAAVVARSTLVKMKVPFSRPSDYFAEMLKSDEHMDKLKQKLIKEATAAKKSEDAKKQRLLKKFGKKVQIATLQERQKQKRETLEKIKSFRKKKGSNARESMNNDEFDIAIEESNAAKDEHSRKRNFRGGPGAGGNSDRRGGSKKTKRPGKSKRTSRR